MITKLIIIIKYSEKSYQLYYKSETKFIITIKELNTTCFFDNKINAII